MLFYWFCVIFLIFCPYLIPLPFKFATSLCYPDGHLFFIRCPGLCAGSWGRWPARGASTPSSAHCAKEAPLPPDRPVGCIEVPILLPSKGGRRGGEGGVRRILRGGVQKTPWPPPSPHFAFCVLRIYGSTYLPPCRHEDGPLCGPGPGCARWNIPLLGAIKVRAPLKQMNSNTSGVGHPVGGSQVGRRPAEHV